MLDERREMKWNEKKEMRVRKWITQKKRNKLNKTKQRKERERNLLFTTYNILYGIPRPNQNAVLRNLCYFSLLDIPEMIITRISDPEILCFMKRRGHLDRKNLREKNDLLAALIIWKEKIIFKIVFEIDSNNQHMNVQCTVQMHMIKTNVSYENVCFLIDFVEI